MPQMCIQQDHCGYRLVHETKKSNRAKLIEDNITSNAASENL